MASIFSGVPFLDFGYQRPPAGNEFYTSFAEGVGRRQKQQQLGMEQERLDLAKQQEGRLQALNQLAMQNEMAEAEIKNLNFQIAWQKRENQVASMRAMPGLLDLMSQQTDWTDISPLRQYAKQFPEVVDTDVWKQAEHKEQAAQTQAAYLARVKEQYDGADDRSDPSGVKTLREIERRRAAGDEEGAAFLEQSMTKTHRAPAKVEILREINRLRESGDLEGADRLERSAMPPNTSSMQTILEKKVLGMNRTIGSFKNLLEGVPINNLTVGPVAFTLRNSIDFIAGLMDEGRFETVGGQERSEVKTLLESGIKQAAREVLDEPSSNLAVSERRMLDDVVKGDRFFTTAPEVKSKLRALLPVFEKSKDNALKAYREGVIPFEGAGAAPTQASLEGELANAMSRYGANSAEARRVGQRLTDFINRGGK